MLRLSLAILWPSFLVAIIAEGFFFSIFDPRDLLLAGIHLEFPSIAVYTIGFFFFWIFCTLASMLTYYLLQAPVNRQPPF
jgi:hypothetical protein